MEPLLSLNDFIAFKELHLPSKQTVFPNGSFELLGDNLKTWLSNLLTKLGVGNQPLVLGKVHPQALVEGRVYISEGAVVEPTAYIQGPAYIGPDSEVRHGAYIRGNVYVGKGCVVGHATEVKSSVFFDGAKAGHFAYVGDSILGRNVNLGAGTKLANLKLKGDIVAYIDPRTKKKVKSSLRKFGAVIGDNVQTGCNSVLSPGSLLLPNTSVMPCAHHFGTLFSKQP